MWVKVFNKILRSTKVSRTSWKLLSTHRSQAKGTCPIKTHCGWALISVKTSSSPRKIYPKLKNSSCLHGDGSASGFYFLFYAYLFFLYFCVAFISIFLLLKKSFLFSLKKFDFLMKILHDSQMHTFSDCTMGTDAEKINLWNCKLKRV